MLFIELQEQNYWVVVLAIAALLDYLIGDPWNWWHPVQGMGWVISQFTQLVLQRSPSAALAPKGSPTLMKVAGISLAAGLVLGSGLLGWIVSVGAQQIHSLVGILTDSVLLASCFAGRSLRDAAQDVLTPLQRGDLDDARSRLSRYVGRDTETLSEAEILRAVLETVTENATDGVLAPLFYALLGACIPGVGSLPLALAYKAASTLDSMVGYRTKPYTDLGWFSAKLDDFLTWIPCRMVVLTLGILSGRPLKVWHICQRDASQDPSPNSGWSECVYAAILGVQVGGVNYYRGVKKLKPLLGEATHEITAKDIEQALRLTRWCFLGWLFGLIAIFLI